MKNPGRLLILEDQRRVLFPASQPIPNKIIFFLIDDNGVKLKDAIGNYRTLVKSFEDAEKLISAAKIFGYQD